MSHFYTILYLTIVSTSIFAMDRKEANDPRNRNNSSYNPRKEFYEQVIPPNKSVADIRDNNKDSLNNKK